MYFVVGVWLWHKTHLYRPGRSCTLCTTQNKILMHRATREKSYLGHHNKGSETLHTVYNVEVYLRTWWRHVCWRVEQKYVRKMHKVLFRKERMYATRFSTSGVAFLRMTVICSTLMCNYHQPPFSNVQLYFLSSRTLVSQILQNFSKEI